MALLAPTGRHTICQQAEDLAFDKDIAMKHVNVTDRQQIAAESLSISESQTNKKCIFTDQSMSCSDEETNWSTSWMVWAQVNFQQIFIFGRTVTLIYSY